jgi:uncharacterized protein
LNRKKSMKTSQPSKILILHGWEGDPNLYWIPVAKQKFEGMGYEVHTPQMPGGYFPKKTEWLKIVGDFKIDENWILIGHSLGGVTILKYLEDTDKKIAEAILIATPFEPMKFNPISNFFGEGFNWAKIKNNSLKFEVLNESNDPVVPVEHGQELAKALGVEPRVVPGGTHFHKIDLEYLEKLLV